mgnify:CR=1 FL=1
MADTQGKKTAQPTTKVEDAKSLLDQVLVKGFRTKTEEQKTEAKKDIEALVRDLMSGVRFGSKRVDKALQERIDALDALLSRQTAAILHRPELQKLEGSWRGLRYLVDKTNTSPMLKVHVLNANKDELRTDQENFGEAFDETELYKKVYEREYGTFEGSPYGALIGDFEWSHSSDDVALLTGLAKVAANAHAPLITAPSPELFGLDDFTQIDGMLDFDKIFGDGKTYAKWNSFRESEDSRYVGLVMPRFLARMPYGMDSRSGAGSFNFEEQVDGTHHDHYVWSNAAYVYGARLTDAFDRHGWCVAIRGVQGGGLVENLPTHVFKTDEGALAMKCPTEVPVNDRQEATLSKLGFLSLVHGKDKDYAAFFGGQSAHKVNERLRNNKVAMANEELSSRLPYLFAVSRFAHYLKSMLRDWTGGFYERSAIEEKLNRWIGAYVLLNDSAGQEIKAKFPLREAKIEVASVDGRPGYYRAVAYLRPHFQLEEIDVSLRLVADLPKRVKG